MIKLLLVFVFGLIETYLFAGWTISANRGKAIESSFLMTSYMLIYLTIILWAMKDANSYLIIAIYAVSAGIGNYIRVRLDKKKQNRPFIIKG